MEFKSPKGFKKKIFGCVLFFLGGLNLVLAVRIGYEIDSFFLFLLLAGALLFFYGLIEGLKENPSDNEKEPTASE